MKKIGVLFIFFLFLLPGWQPAFADGPNPAGDLLELWFKPVSQEAAGMAADPRLNPRAAVMHFYQRRDFQPAWIGHGGPLPQLEILLQAIGRATANGLREKDYAFWNFDATMVHDVRFTDEIERLNNRDLAALDAALTDVMLRYAANLSQGRVRPEELPPSFAGDEPSSPRDLPAELADAINNGELESFIQDLSPQHRQYRTLKETLRRYRQIQDDGGWPQIGEGPGSKISGLKLGDTGARVKALHRHLTITGDLQADPGLPDDRFGPPLEAALKRFQRRHGLNPDGIVGRRTLEVLNIPVEARMLQLMLNMERWRWYPQDLGARYLMVNIPAFELRLVQDRTETLSMRVIVGRKKRPTPVLSSRLTYLEVNPYWNVPQKIARKDLLPKIQADPEYLVRQKIQVFDSWQQDAPALDPLAIDWAGVSENHFPYRLRQEPADRNALGRIKFMFPNSQSVYIHDTPGKALFKKASRPFSSGCVRVEDPKALAVQLLKDQHWTHRRLEKYSQTHQNSAIALETPVPVYLVYFTAWTDAEGQIHFGDDIYNHDRRLLLDLLKDAPKHTMCSFIEGPGKATKMCGRRPARGLINTVYTGAMERGDGQGHLVN
jgi:murein L,D-transpeptidase YcbB/YkuD